MPKKPINLRVDESWLREIDAWIERQPFTINRSDLIRVAVESYIRGGDFAREQGNRVNDRVREAPF